MTTPGKKLAPEEAWEALERMSVDDEIDDVLALSDEAVDEELRKTSANPGRIRERGEALGRELDRKAAASKGGRVPAPRRAWLAWVAAAAAAAAAVVILFVVFKNKAGPTTPIGSGDTGFPRQPPVPSVEPPTAPDLREQAYAACDIGDFAECGRKLDDARRLDPSGETDPRVVRARAQIKGSDKPHRDKP
ncbi:MAG TPA: hypothetical protein VGL81_21970 [Polyangiaceae bacterium]|jgi:hypothetical protein